VREINKEEFFLTHIIEHVLAFLLTIEHCELLKKEGMNSWEDVEILYKKTYENILIEHLQSLKKKSGALSEPKKIYK
jgi:hypothetical protein